MYRPMMIVLGAVGVAWGITAWIAPDGLAQLYGGALDPFGRAFSNVGGAIALGFGLVDWSLRNTPEPKVRRHVLIGNLVAVALVALSLLMSTASGTFNSLGWIGALLHAVLAAVVFVTLLQANRA